MGISKNGQRTAFPVAVYGGGEGSPGEHAYIIYNRRFDEMQIISVYAAEVAETAARIDSSEHSEYDWLPYEVCLDRVHFRGLKDGLRSVHEYITSVPDPAKELCLFKAS